MGSNSPFIGIVNSYNGYVPGFQRLRVIEAAAGGVIALVEEGDIIMIDILNRNMEMLNKK